MRLLLGVILAVLLTGCGDRAPGTAPLPEAGPTTRAPRSEPWDPRKVDRLPPAEPGSVGGLPAVLQPPASAPSLGEHPLTAALLSVQTDDAVLLLGTDGSWRQVPAPDGYAGAALTADGTRLALTMDGGVEVWDLATGHRHEIADPTGFTAWDFVSWGWVDDSTLLLHDGSPGGWVVGVGSGSAQHVAYPKHGGYYAVDAAGAVVESAGWGHPDVLTDWAGGSARRVGMRQLGRLAHVMVDEDTVVGTTYEHRPFSVVVADRSDLRLRSSLPILDHDGNYSPGLRPVVLRSDGSVLLCVQVFGRVPGWRLVAWDPASDDLSLVTRGSATVTSYATSLLD